MARRWRGLLQYELSAGDRQIFKVNAVLFCWLRGEDEVDRAMATALQGNLRVQRVADMARYALAHRRCNLRQQLVEAANRQEAHGAQILLLLEDLRRHCPTKT